ncbi:MAG: CPBP family intramembrane metalloprotease [Myxococcales bacterium]|nr:CPBP family intramembrane metalloprotease [Myxococcales bacterium]
MVAFATFAVGLAVMFVAWGGVGDPWRSLLYHFIFGLGVCVMFPTWYVVATGRSLEDMGLSLDQLGRNVLVGVIAACVTVPWRLGGSHLPELRSLATLIAAMCFSTLFEEVFFRGFLQTRVEAVMGLVPAVAVSSLAFALYHLGYGGEWRHLESMIRMTLVGVMFGAVFRLTKNVATSFLLNLPHAVVTFLERQEFFSDRAAITSIVVVVLAGLWMRKLARVVSVK